MGKYFKQSLLARGFQKRETVTPGEGVLWIPQTADLDAYDGESAIVLYNGEDTADRKKNHFYVKQQTGTEPIYREDVFALPARTKFLEIVSNREDIPSGIYYNIPEVAAEIIEQYGDLIRYTVTETKNGAYPTIYRMRNDFDVVRVGDFVWDSAGGHTITAIPYFFNVVLDGTTTISFKTTGSSNESIKPFVGEFGNILYYSEGKAFPADELRTYNNKLYGVWNGGFSWHVDYTTEATSVTVKTKIGEKPVYTWYPVEVQDTDLSNYQGDALFNDNVTVKGDLIVEGKEIVSDVETIQSEDDFILLRFNNPAALGDNFSGLKFLNYDGNGATLQLVVSGDGILRLGLADSLEPVTTRDEAAAMEANGVTIWDADGQKLKTATQITNFVKSYELTAQTQITEINSMTQSAYDALTTKNDNKLYVII